MRLSAILPQTTDSWFPKFPQRLRVYHDRGQGGAEYHLVWQLAGLVRRGPSVHVELPQPRHVPT